jgi:FixJ family two-component response regulator
MDVVICKGVLPELIVRDDVSEGGHAKRGRMPIVFVIADSICVRESLKFLIQNAGLQPETVETAQEFFPRLHTPVPSCLVLDLTPPDLNGLELQRRLATDRPDIPIIFTTDHGDLPITVQAMKAGASDFLTKPITDAVLLSAIRLALERSEAALRFQADIRPLEEHYKQLSRREREVMALLVRGLSNKYVGFELGISEITVKAHRGQVMRKMNAGSFAELVNMAGKLRLPPPGS